MNWYNKIICAGFPTYKPRQIAKKLRRLGFIYLRPGKGSHEIWGTRDGNIWGSFPMGNPHPVTIRDIVVKDLHIPYKRFMAV
jgi:hypothetical protein